jgi:hypothetical protein
MTEPQPAIDQAEAIAREAKREEIDRLVRICEQSQDTTLRDLARIYRMVSSRL